MAGVTVAACAAVIAGGSAAHATDGSFFRFLVSGANPSTDDIDCSAGNVLGQDGAEVSIGVLGGPDQYRLPVGVDPAALKMLVEVFAPPGTLVDSWDDTGFEDAGWGEPGGLPLPEGSGVSFSANPVVPFPNVQASDLPLVLQAQARYTLSIGGAVASRNTLTVTMSFTETSGNVACTVTNVVNELTIFDEEVTTTTSPTTSVPGPTTSMPGEDTTTSTPIGVPELPPTGSGQQQQLLLLLAVMVAGLGVVLVRLPRRAPH